MPCWIRWPDGKLGEPRDIDDADAEHRPAADAVRAVRRRAAEVGRRPTSCTAASASPGCCAATQKELPDRKFVVQYGQIPKKFDACVIWGKWRLVKGEELYDVEADRAQKTNVADKHPDVVKAMRDHYEAWWKGVEPMLNDFVPISIGAKQQPVVELTSGDWEGIYADNTGYVREAVGGPTGGHWHIKVEEAGEYEFTLRRWPEQTKAALGDKYEPSREVARQQGEASRRVGFPTIAGAKIEIAGVKAEAKADPKATGATLTREAAGRARRR